MDPAPEKEAAAATPAAAEKPRWERPLVEPLDLADAQGPTGATFNDGTGTS